MKMPAKIGCKKSPESRALVRKLTVCAHRGNCQNGTETILQGGTHVGLSAATVPEM